MTLVHKEGKSLPHFALFPVGGNRNNDYYKSLYNVNIIEYGTIEQFVEVSCDWIDLNFKPIESKDEKTRDDSKPLQN